MAVCPVCGCRTDELDFVQGKVGSWSGNICSFCEKQLKGIDAKNGLTEAQFRWVTAALSKDIQRDENLLSELNALSGVSATAEAPQQYPVVTHYSASQSTPVKSPAGGQANDELVRQLEKRVEQLEKQLRIMKRSALIKTILEICIPIILGIVILIVFFSSGLFDYLSSLYNELM